MKESEIVVTAHLRIEHDEGLDPEVLAHFAGEQMVAVFPPNVAMAHAFVRDTQDEAIETDDEDLEDYAATVEASEPSLMTLRLLGAMRSGEVNESADDPVRDAANDDPRGERDR